MSNINLFSESLQVSLLPNLGCHNSRAKPLPRYPAVEPHQTDVAHLHLVSFTVSDKIYIIYDEHRRQAAVQNWK